MDTNNANDYFRRLARIFSMCFPRISNSIFTVSPFLSVLKFVCLNVCGIIVTLNLLPCTSKTVRLTPLMQMLPFSITRFGTCDLGFWSSNANNQLPFSLKIDLTFAFVSTCPCTKCPSSRSPIFKERSRLTMLPFFNEPRLVLLIVSLTAVT